MRKTFGVAAALMCSAMPVAAGNPIIPNQGVNDPHVRIFGDTAYLYASHDESPRNRNFVMKDWQVWSSKDLVNWTLRSTLYPDEPIFAISRILPPPGPLMPLKRMVAITGTSPRAIVRPAWLSAKAQQAPGVTPWADHCSHPSRSDRSRAV